MKNRKNIIVSSSLAIIIGSALLFSAVDNMTAVDIEQYTTEQQQAKEYFEGKTSSSEKADTGFEYITTSSGGTSSAMVATLNGVQHVYAWGNNTLGQLGVGKIPSTVDTSTPAGAKNMVTYAWEYETNYAPKDGEPTLDESYLNSIKSLPTPEDINIDGGAAGIQGEVLNITMGDAVTYAVIKPTGSEVLDIYATGSNVYGQLGNGGITNWDTASADNQADWGYRPSWEKIEFKDADGNVVQFTEILALSSNKSTYLSGIDTNGNNRVFAWGYNGTGMLGTGRMGEAINWGGNASADVLMNYNGLTNGTKYSINDTPQEITGNILLPKYVANEVVIEDGYDWATNYLYTEEEYRAKSDTLNYVNIETGTVGHGNIHTDYSADEAGWAEVVEANTPNYPFETEHINGESGWKIVDFKVGKVDTIFVAQDAAGHTALLSSGYTMSKYPDFFMQGVTVEAQWTDSSTNADKPYGVYTGNASIPLLWYWDGIPADIFFKFEQATSSGADVIGTELDYTTATSIEFIGVETTPLMTMLALRIDGRDHLFTYSFNSNDNNFGVRRFLSPSEGITATGAADLGLEINGTALAYPAEFGHPRASVAEVNLGYDAALTAENGGTPTSGLRAGDEIVQIFRTTDITSTVGGALIKTASENGGDDVYSVILWGSNEDTGLIDPTQFSSIDGWSDGVYDAKVDKSKYMANTVMSLTTATSSAEIASNELAQDWLFTEGTPVGSRSIDQFLTDPYGNNIYNPASTYVITEVIPGGTSLTIEVTDGTNTYRYFLGDNKAQQISSDITDPVVLAPTPLFISSSPTSDSFALNYNTTTTGGIDFSIDVTSGGEFESFTPPTELETGTEDSSLRFYADINGDGETITTGDSREEIGFAAGSLEYIGRGTTNTSGDIKVPLYDTTPLTEAEQQASMYEETYNFRVTDLEPATAYDHLYVQVNGHNPIAVDGILQTEQRAKFTSDATHMSIQDTGSDYATIRTELLYDVPGFEAIGSTPTVSDLQNNMIISFEDSAGNVYSNNTTLGSLTSATPIELTVESVGAAGDPGQTLEAGQTPIGQEVIFTIHGDALTSGETYNNFKLFYDLDDAEQVSVWEDETDISATTVLSKDLKVTMDSDFVMSSTFDNLVVTDQTARFTLDLQAEIGKEYTTPVMSTLKVTADQSVSGGTVEEDVVLTASSTIATDDTTGIQTITVDVTNLRSDAVYTDVNVSLSDAESTYHTATTVTTTDPDFTIETSAKGEPTTPTLDPSTDITVVPKQNSATVSFQNDSLINVTETTTLKGKTITNITASSATIPAEDISAVTYDTTTGEGSFTISNLTSETTYNDVQIAINWTITTDGSTVEQTPVTVAVDSFTTIAKTIPGAPTITTVTPAPKVDSAVITVTGSNFSDLAEDEANAGRVIDSITTDIAGATIMEDVEGNPDITVTDTEIQFTLIGLAEETTYSGAVTIAYHNIVDGTDVPATSVVSDTFEFTTIESGTIEATGDATISNLASNTVELNVEFTSSAIANQLTQAESAEIRYNDELVDSQFVSMDTTGTIATYRITNLEETTAYTADGWNYTLPEYSLSTNTFDLTLDSGFTTGYIDEAIVNATYGLNVIEGSWKGTTFQGQVLFEDTLTGSEWQDDIKFTSNGEEFSIANGNLAITSTNTEAWSGMTLVTFTFSGLTVGQEYSTWTMDALDANYLTPASRYYDESHISTTDLTLESYALDPVTNRPLDKDGNEISDLGDLGNAGNIEGTIDIDGDGNDDSLVVWNNPDGSLGSIEIQIDGNDDNAIVITPNGDGTFTIDWPEGLWGLPGGEWTLSEDPAGSGNWSLSGHGSVDVLPPVTDGDGNTLIGLDTDGDGDADLNLIIDGDGNLVGVDTDGDGIADIDVDTEIEAPGSIVRRDNEAIVNTRHGLDVVDGSVTSTSFKVEVTFKGNVTDPTAEEFQNVKFFYGGSEEPMNSTLVGPSSTSSKTLVYEISGLTAGTEYTEDGWQVFALDENYLSSSASREVSTDDYIMYDVKLNGGVKTSTPDESNFPWWILIVLIILTAGIAGFLVWFLVLRNKEEKEEKGTGTSKKLETSTTTKKSKKALKEEYLNGLTKAQLMKIATEIYDKDSLKDYSKEDLVELLMDEDIEVPEAKATTTSKATTEKATTSKKETRREKLEKMTKAQLMKLATEVYDKDSLKDYSKEDLVDLVEGEKDIKI